MRMLLPDLAVLVAIVAVLGLIAFAAVLSWESSLLLELRFVWARLLRLKARWAQPGHAAGYRRFGG